MRFVSDAVHRYFDGCTNTDYREGKRMRRINERKLNWKQKHNLATLRFYPEVVAIASCSFLQDVM